ncbi:MAG: hypothetical protein JOZ22_26450 [Acidobacteriia bacterium]|nr:hypothetical protein [Terriglobia bacterium]
MRPVLHSMVLGLRTLCYDVHVKRSAVQQGVKQGRLLIKHLLPAVWKPIHSLWHEVIAFVFLCLAIWSGFWSVRQMHEHNGKFYLGVAVTALLFWYGVDGFLRARKISRS